MSTCDCNTFHDASLGVDNHVIWAFSYDNEAARLAATGWVRFSGDPEAPFTTNDVGKVAKQIDDQTYWVLTGIGPTTWKELTNTSFPKLMGCDAGVAVDDLVYQSSTTDNLAVKAINNMAIEPIRGHVISKPTTTTCIVQVKGFVNYAISRGRLFLSSTGTYTNIPPASGYLQELGWSCGSGHVEINPNLTRVKRA